MYQIDGCISLHAHTFMSKGIRLRCQYDILILILLQSIRDTFGKSLFYSKPFSDNKTKYNIFDSLVCNSQHIPYHRSRFLLLLSLLSSVMCISVFFFTASSSVSTPSTYTLPLNCSSEALSKSLIMLSHSVGLFVVKYVRMYICAYGYISTAVFTRILSMSCNYLKTSSK